MGRNDATRAQAAGKRCSRRQFLNTTAAGAGAFALAGRAVAQAPQPAAGPGSGVLGANERVVMGIIGSGGMGRGHMEEFKKCGVQWAAVCDVYEPNLQAGLESAGSRAKGYTEHEKLLERKDLDAVLIASPEHWHHKHLIDAVRAGKDAYCEKPMSWSIEQGAEMVAEVRKTDRIVQIGMQRRSAPAIQEMKQLFVNKALGDIYLVQAEWFWVFPIRRASELPGKLDWERFCGPAGKQDFDPLKFLNWRYYWAFSGGNVTDQGAHLLDVTQWMMDADQPLSATQIGEVYFNKPTETPDYFSCTFRYPKFIATWTLGYETNRWRNGWSLVFHGNKGSLFLTEDGYRLFNQVNGWEKGLPKPIKQNMPGGVTSTGPHTRNFLECIKTRKQPNATVELGHQAVRTLHLANAALRARREAVLDTDGVTVKV